MAYLRYYYLRYLFSYDPSKTWLLHSIKTMLVSALAITIAMIEMSIHAVWIILPCFLIMLLLNVQLPFRQRIYQLITMWAICFGVVLLMMLAHHHEWLRVILFLVIALVACFSANYGPDKIKLGVLASIFALLAMRFQVNGDDIKIISVNYCLGFVILLITNTLIFPNKLPSQIRSSLLASFRILGQYYYFLLSDATVGNHDTFRRSELQQQTLLVLESLKKITQAYQKVNPSTQYVAMTMALQQLIYLAIGVEAAISRLTVRAYFNGPLSELQNYGTLYRKIFIAARQRDYSVLQHLPEAQKKLLSTISAQKENLNGRLSTLSHDYQQWFQVAFCIESFNHQLEQYVTILKDHCDAGS